MIENNGRRSALGRLALAARAVICLLGALALSTCDVSALRSAVQDDVAVNTAKKDSLPYISLGSASVNFYAVPGGSSPAAQTVSIANRGGGSLASLSASVSYSGSASGWLSASVTTSVLTLTPNTLALPAGSYAARVSLASNAENGAVGVDVSLVVSNEPGIGLSSTSLSFSAIAGGSDPAAQTVSVSNVGVGTLSGLSTKTSYSSNGSGWLTESLDTTTAPATLTLQAKIGSLGAGSYTATVSVMSSVAANTPQTISVSFAVSSSSSPVISLSSASLSFMGAPGGSSPSVQTVKITNGGAGTLGGLSASVSYSNGLGWLSASMNATTAPATLTVQATIGSLAAGSYSATISVASSAAANSPQSISVTLIVSSQPLISLSSSSMSFSGAVGGQSPSAQNVQIVNAGGGSLSGLSTSIAYSNGLGWLAASLDTTTAPASLTVQASSAGLAAGSYSATVSVASSGAANSPQTIGVTLNLSSLPTIVLSSSSLSFAGTTGSSNPAAQTAQISNGGVGSLTGLSTNVEYSNGSGWLNVSLNSNSAPATLTVQAITGSLTAGSYGATISVASTVASNSPQTISIAFTLQNAPSISLSSSSLDFAAVPGGSNPGSHTVQITNGGGESLSGLSANIAYTNGSGWLSATLDTTTAPATLTVQALTGSLAAGSYSATIAVTSSLAANSPRNIAVSFTLAYLPQISLSASSLSFSAVIGGQSPAKQTVSITNGGGGSLSGLSTSIAYSNGLGWLAASLDTTTAPASLTVQASSAGLAAGSYSATVSVASSGAANSPQTIAIAIAFTVAAQPIISLSSPSLAYAAASGGSDPPSQAVQITNSGGSTLSGLSASVSYASGSGWLSATLNTTTAPATLTVQATTGSLATGSYAATISVAASGAANTPQTVAVSFTLSSTGSFNLSLAKRLLVMSGAYQPVTFASQVSLLCAMVVPEYGNYSLSWSDSKQGDGKATVDVVANMYDSSSTLVSSVKSVDSAYTTPITLSLSPGTYFLVLSSYSKNPVSGSCSVEFYELGDQDQYNVSGYRRLLVADEYTGLTFSNETAKYLVLNIATAGSYEFRWSDSKDGRGGDTADVAVSLFASDQTTVVGGFSAVDSGYTSPHAATLAAGTYFVEVASYSGGAISGTCFIKVAPLSTDGEIVAAYYQRLLLVPQFSVVKFASQAERDLVVTIPAAGTYTFVMSDASQGDGTDTVDVLVSLYDESGFPVGSYTGLDSAYAGAQLTVAAGTYHIGLVTKNAQGASGTCKVMLY